MMIENCMQSIPLAVLKHPFSVLINDDLPNGNCMQSIPLAVLKRQISLQYQTLRIIACNPYRLRYFFYFSVRFFQTAAFFYGIMELSKKIFPGRDSDVCHLYDVGGNESD